KDTTLTVFGANGTLGAGEKIQISTDGTTWNDVVQDSSNAWHYVDGTAHNTTFTYSTQIVDAASNVGTTTSQFVTIDTGLPTLTIDAITGDDNFNANDAANAAGIDITGTASDASGAGVVGQTVSVQIVHGANAPAFTSSAVVQSDGTWSVHLTQQQIQGIADG